MLFRSANQAGNRGRRGGTGRIARTCDLGKLGRQLELGFWQLGALALQWLRTRVFRIVGIFGFFRVIQLYHHHDHYGQLHHDDWRLHFWGNTCA